MNSITNRILESRFEILGLSVLAGLFLYWDLSRAIYILTAFFAIGFYLARRPRLDREFLYYSLPIGVFFVAMLVAAWHQGFTDSGLNALFSRYALLLLAIPLAALCLVKSSCGIKFWLKFVIVGLLLGVTALIDFLLFDKARANGGDNAVVFGFVALGITSVIAGSYPDLRRYKYGVTLYLASIAAGIIAIVLSGSRGSWIAAAVVTFAAAIYLFDRYSLSKRFLLGCLMMAVIAAVAMAIPQVQKRVTKAVEILTPYVKGEAQTGFSSARYRVEGWKGAWQMAMDNKLLGVGPGNYRRSLQQYVADKYELRKLDSRMRHAHNQYMQTLATSGFIGLLALLYLVGGHAWLFSRYLGKTYPDEVRSFALAGLLLVIAYLFLGLTGVPFERKKLLLLYAFSSAACWGCMLTNLRLAAIADSETRHGRPPVEGSGPASKP